MNGIHDNGETKGLDKKRFDMAGVVGDIVIDRGGVFVGVAVTNRIEVVFDEGPEDGGVVGGWGSGVGLEGNDCGARGWKDELELSEVMGARFVGVRRGWKVIEASFGGSGGAEG